MTERYDLKCECGDTKDHLVILEFDEQDWKDTVTIGLYMNHYLPWYKRLVNAVKYVFGIDNTYQHYVEAMYNKKTIGELRKWLDQIHGRMS